MINSMLTILFILTEFPKTEVKVMTSDKKNHSPSLMTLLTTAKSGTNFFQGLAGGKSNNYLPPA